MKLHLSFLTSLFLLFLGLKLAGVITWPWLWVFAPLWVPVALVVGLSILVGLVFLVAFLIVCVASVIEVSGPWRKKL